jgi:hypothetical protein
MRTQTRTVGSTCGPLLGCHTLSVQRSRRVRPRALLVALSTARCTGAYSEYIGAAGAHGPSWPDLDMLNPFADHESMVGLP